MGRSRAIGGLRQGPNRRGYPGGRPEARRGGEPRVGPLAALAAGAAALLLGGAARAEGPAPAERGRAVPGAPRWIFAVEDTLDLPVFFEMSEVEIRADRLRIGEIVDRCIRREEEMRARIVSHEYTVTAKTVLWIGGEGEEAERRLVTEQVERRWDRAGAEPRRVLLKRERYVLKDGRKEPLDPDENAPVEFGYSQFAELPFYLRDRDAYRFEILSREIVGESVIYEVGLEPRSAFAVAPSGRIWVDTSTFSILREEFDFGDRGPLPIFVEHLGPFIRERERIGDLWVWKRLVIRARLRGRTFRWIDRDLPDTAEFLVEFRDHRLEARAAPPAREGESPAPGGRS